ncbi:MAG: hypothetical protein FJ388_17060 [Verrucomicrobia bacterium]|nr:hypothetical protein [Verrucomicrobiota bacterium]
MKLPTDLCDTPDAMCLLPNGDIILSVPNVQDQTKPCCLLKVAARDNKVSLFCNLPPHPESGKVLSLGVCRAPSGDLYVADNQQFLNLKHKSRVLRVKVKGGKAVGFTTVASGLMIANAVQVHGGYLWVTDSQMLPDSKPLVSGLFRFKLNEENVQMKVPLDQDPHFVAKFVTNNPNIPVGADGLTFDRKGNAYIGNFGDGVIHKVEFDAKGKVKSNTVFAKTDFMKSCDGLFYDRKSDKIFCADYIGNAIQVITLDGEVTTLAKNGEEVSKLDGGLSGPCEPLVRGKDVIVSNMDFPFGPSVVKKHTLPATLVVIKLGPEGAK